MASADAKTATPLSASQPANYRKAKHYTPSVLAADVATAAAVGLTASIPISIIDYSIMAKVAGVAESSRAELFKGIRTLFRAPHHFFLKTEGNHYATVYRACSVVYFSTYLTSNSTKSYFESRGWEPNLAAGIASGLVNIAATVWKDGVILKVLPSKKAEDIAKAKLPVPYFSRFLFAVRDMATCVAAFTIAPVVATYLAANYRREQLPLSAADCGQIVTPAALQTITTVIHITGIRYHATQGNLSMASLAQSVRENYVQSTLLRICRIIPAFGIGGIFNREMRWSLLDRVEK